MYNLSGLLTNYLGYLQLLHPFFSLCCFRPALHIPLCERLDVAGRWDGTLGTVVPASRAARSTVMDLRLQVFCLSRSGCIRVGFCWGASSGSCAEQIRLLD